MLEQQSDHQPGLPEFPVVLRGYDRTEVDDYLRRLAQWASDERHRAETAARKGEAAVGEARHLRDRIAGLEEELERSSAPPSSSWAALGDEAADLFRKASEAAAGVERKATEQAEATLAEARSSAQRTVDAAAAKAREIEETAARQRDAAERILGGARAEAEAEAHRLKVAALAEAESRVQESREQAVKIVVEAEEARRTTLGRLDTQRVEVEAQINQLIDRRDALLDELDRLRDVLDSVTSHLRSRAAHQLFDGPEDRPRTDREREPLAVAVAAAPEPEIDATPTELHVPTWLNDPTPYPTAAQSDHPANGNGGNGGSHPGGLFD